jgi:hypothetical protein
MEQATRVAVIYDVHGNLPALEAVLSDVERVEPDLVVVGGTRPRGRCPRRYSTGWRVWGTGSGRCAATPTGRSSRPTTVGDPRSRLACLPVGAVSIARGTSIATPTPSCGMPSLPSPSARSSTARRALAQSSSRHSPYTLRVFSRTHEESTLTKLSTARRCPSGTVSTAALEEAFS